MLSSSPEVQEVHSRGKGNSAHSLQYALSARTGHRDNKSPNIKMALNDSCFCWQLEKLQLHSQLSSPEEKQLPENVMPSFWESSRRAVIVNLICFWWFGGNLTMLFLHFSRPLAKKKLLLMHQTVEWSEYNGKVSNLPFICIYDRFSYTSSPSFFLPSISTRYVKVW